MYVRVVLYICLKKTNFSERFLFMPQYGAFNCYQNVLLNTDLLIPTPSLVPRPEGISNIRTKRGQCHRQFSHRNGASQ